MELDGFEENYDEAEAMRIMETISYVLGILSVDNKIWEIKLMDHLSLLLEPEKLETRRKIRSMIKHLMTRLNKPKST